MHLRFGLCGAAAALLLAIAAAPAGACTDVRAAPTSRWSVTNTPSGPVLLTPCGQPFFSLGIDEIDGGIAKWNQGPRAYRWNRFAPSRAAWAAATRQRLLDWGFNTAGAWSLGPSEIGLPSTPDLELGSQVRFAWIDPFDPALPARIDRFAEAAVAPYRGNPLRIGYFSDNEIGWWNGPLFTTYLAYPPENYTKNRLVDLLRQYYRNDWSAFTRDFVPAPGVTGFDGLLASRETAHLRPGGNGIAVVRAWTGVVAGHYYRVMRDAVHKADPEALYLGDRLPIYYDPDAVRAMVPYVDVISVNYNVDTADGWIAPYFFNGLHGLSGGKPVLITEWFYAAKQNRSGNLDRTGEPHDKAHAKISNNRNRTGHLMTVETQAERALGAGRALRLMAAMPDVVGVHWFEYADEPPGGRADGEDYDFGIVDVDNRPYERLTEALRGGNRWATSRLARAFASAKAAAAIADNGNIPAPPVANDANAGVVPHAEIDPAEESLADWPKNASLIAMKPTSGEVDFGDVFLVWDERGLTIATIAMDYYDPSLLGTLSPFPRSEAFRIALGVDAGGGPHRVEVRVVPTSVRRTATDEEKLTFGAQVCWYQEGDACASVPGATARYFGTALDQPRVILKAFVPWAALGVAKPPSARTLRLALGVTAFYRSRWMSDDGIAPDVAMAHPANWREFRLGGAAAPDFPGPPPERAAE